MSEINRSVNKKIDNFHGAPALWIAQFAFYLGTKAYPHPISWASIDDSAQLLVLFWIDPADCLV
jgi:hypothetical protein